MKILSLAPSSTEILFDLGMGDHVIGRTRFCNHPKEAETIPNVGGWLDVDFKKIEKLKPDLIMTSTFVQDKLVEELKSRGFNVFHLDPITLEDVFESILATGKAVNKYEKAVIIVDKMKTKIASIKARLLNVKDIPNIYVEEWHMPPTASGNWVPDILKIVKANSIIPSGRRSTETGSRALQVFNPKKIIISWCGFGKSIKPEVLDSITKRDGYNKIDAIKNGQIYVIDDSLLNRPGPRLIEGMEKLASLIHPDHFSDNPMEDLFKKISSHNEGTTWHGENQFED